MSIENDKEISGNCGTCAQKECQAKTKLDGESEHEFAKRQSLAAKLCKVKKKIIVLSGKGGVGKSTVAANLAVALSLKGWKTGLLDVDLHGPSIPGILGAKNEKLKTDGHGGIRPFEPNPRLKVVSIAFLIDGERDAIIWRGPMKYGAIKQLLENTDWSELDFMIVDCPPGTGDEPLSVAQLLVENSSALLVTTPQTVATDDVRRSITFCNELGLAVSGLVENMSGCICPHCRKNFSLFGAGGGEKLASEMDIPFLGRIPFDPQVMESGENGSPFVSSLSCETKTLLLFEKIVDTLANEELR